MIKEKGKLHIFNEGQKGSSREVADMDGWRSDVTSKVPSVSFLYLLGAQLPMVSDPSQVCPPIHFKIISLFLPIDLSIVIRLSLLVY